MATTITPVTGAGCLYTQQGIGTSPGYDAVDERRSNSGGIQEGVYAAGSFEVTQRAAGVNLSVDIAASTHENGIAAYVAGDSIVGQALYQIPPHTGVINEAITAAHATNPRVDRVVLEIQDNVHDASGQNRAQVRVIAGTASGGATLDNLTGAAAVPSNCLLLADVHVPALDTTIANSQIRDRRKWARGAYATAKGSNAGNNTTTSAVLAELSTYTKRIECSGAPLCVEFTARAWHSIATGTVQFVVDEDGVTKETIIATSWDINEPANFTLIAEYTPTAGSHLVKIKWANPAGAGTATLENNSGLVPKFCVSEIVRQNTGNNATTSG